MTQLMLPKPNQRHRHVQLARVLQPLTTFRLRSYHPHSSFKGECHKEEKLMADAKRAQVLAAMISQALLDEMAKCVNEKPTLASATSILASMEIAQTQWTVALTQERKSIPPDQR
jgi:hypothetical protein